MGRESVVVSHPYFSCTDSKVDLKSLWYSWLLLILGEMSCLDLE